MSHITTTLFSQPNRIDDSLSRPHRSLVHPPRFPLCRPCLTYPILGGKRPITLITPTLYVPAPSLSRSPLTMVLRNQEWPAHSSCEERHLEPGATPNTMQWQEMEAPMPIFGASPTFFHRHYHSFTVTPSSTKKTSMYSPTSLCRDVGPNTSVYDPIPMF